MMLAVVEQDPCRVLHWAQVWVPRPSGTSSGERNVVVVSNGTQK